MTQSKLIHLAAIPLLLSTSAALAAPPPPVLHTAMIEIQEMEQERKPPLIFSVPVGGEVYLQIDSADDSVSAYADAEDLGWHHLRLRREQSDNGPRFRRVVELSPEDLPGLYEVQIRVTDATGQTSVYTVLVDVYDEEVGC